MSFNITFSNINATLLLNWFLNDFQGVFFEQFRALVKKNDEAYVGRMAGLLPVIQSRVNRIADYLRLIHPMHMFVRVERPYGSKRFVMGYVKCDWVFSFARKFEQMRVQLNRIPPVTLRDVEEEENKALRLAYVGETDYERALTTYRNNNREPPLNAALEAKDEDAAETLLDGGDNPNKVDYNGYNALHVAAWNGCRLPLFNRILERIKNVNAITRMNSGCRTNGCTALMFAATNNHLDMVTALMQHPKIDLNVQNRDKETALHVAVNFNRPAIVAQLLSDSRIDTSLKDITAETPLKKAIRWKRAECVKILREHGAPEE